MSHADNVTKDGGASALAPLFGQLVIAIGAALTAWVTLSTRFQRVQRLRTDCARVEPSFFFFYLIPQYLNAGLFLLVVAAAAVAVIGGLMTNAIPGLQIQGANTTFGHFAIGIYRLGWWVVMLGVAAGGIAILDVFARLLLWLARLLSWLPLRGLEGHFGPDGLSLGWLQAREFVRGGGSALPLAINPRGLERVIDPVMALLVAEGADGTDRAPTPTGTDSARGNIAIFACILEQAEADLQLPRRALDKFYAAFGKVQAAADFFEPAHLYHHADGRAFYAALRAQIDPILADYGECGLPTDLTVSEAVKQAFDRLKKRYVCDVTRLVERYPIAFRSKAVGLYRRASAFPRLGEPDRMRPQFVKLCLRWKVIPLTDGDRLYPAFAAAIGWLMLNAGAIEALQEVKSVPFRGPMNQPAVRVAEMRLIDKIADRLDGAPVNDAPKLLGGLQDLPSLDRRWMIEQEIDTALWRIARAQIATVRQNDWKGARWKLDDVIAVRA